MTDQIVLFSINVLLRNTEKAKKYINAYMEKGIHWAVLTYDNYGKKEEIEEQLYKLGLLSDTVFTRKRKDNRSILKYAMDVTEAIKTKYDIAAIYLDTSTEPDKTLSKVSQLKQKVFFL